MIEIEKVGKQQHLSEFNSKVVAVRSKSSIRKASKTADITI